MTCSYVVSKEVIKMTDYTGAIYGLIGLGVVLTVGVVFVLAQPTDLPVLKKDKRQN